MHTKKFERQNRSMNQFSLYQVSLGGTERKIYMLEVINVLSSIPILISIVVSIYKILSVVICKITKKKEKISSYGFLISIMLLIFYYAFIRETTILFWVSLITLGLGLLIHNLFRDFKEDMFAIPAFAYIIFCIILANRLNFILLILSVIVFIPDIIRIILQIFDKTDKK